MLKKLCIYFWNIYVIDAFMFTFFYDYKVQKNSIYLITYIT